MNFRVIVLIILVLIFTICGISIWVISFQSTSLQNSYNAGEAEITQNTAAGTVPHVILVKNNGKKPLMVETGQILESSSSQDLVVAEDKVVNQNSSSLIRAYCYQPNQTATPGIKLKPTNKASSEIKQIIKNSKLSDSQNITRTQLQIWILASKNNLNINSGEASVFIENQGISKTEINQKVQEARNDILKTFNITEGEIKNLNPTSTISLDDIFNWINNFINWIKNSFNNN